MARIAARTLRPVSVEKCAYSIGAFILVGFQLLPGHLLTNGLEFGNIPNVDASRQFTELTRLVVAGLWYSYEAVYIFPNASLINIDSIHVSSITYVPSACRYLRVRCTYGNAFD